MKKRSRKKTVEAVQAFAHNLNLELEKALYTKREDEYTTDNLVERLQEMTNWLNPPDAHAVLLEKSAIEEAEEKRCREKELHEKCRGLISEIRKHKIMLPVGSCATCLEIEAIVGNPDDKPKDEADDWKQIGVIGVDAGLCWIGDPCYVIHTDGGRTGMPEDIGENWEQFCDKVTKGLHRQFKYDRGHDGLGVCVSSGYGDGTYPVLAKIKDDTVEEIRVVFVDSEED